MKLSCKVIEDILPMYYDKVCSEESAELVEKHLRSCAHCRQILADLGTDIEVPEKNMDDIKPLRKIQKQYKKTKTRWLVAILTVIALIPVTFLGWNEFSAQGAAYSNQDELVCANNFMTCLQKGDYAKAYTYLDVEAKKHDWLENWFEEEDLVNMEADGLEKFCELGKEKVEALGGIDTYEYIGVSASYGTDYRGAAVHQVIYRIQFNGQNRIFYVNVSNNGIHSLIGGDGLMEDPLGQFCMWGEWLWQDYQGCYYDFDLKQYVYYD